MKAELWSLLLLSCCLCRVVTIALQNQLLYAGSDGKYTDTWIRVKASIFLCWKGCEKGMERLKLFGRCRIAKFQGRTVYRGVFLSQQPLGWLPQWVTWCEFCVWMKSTVLLCLQVLVFDMSLCINAKTQDLEFLLPSVVSNSHMFTCWCFFLLFNWAVTKKHICLFARDQYEDVWSILCSPAEITMLTF